MKSKLKRLATLGVAGALALGMAMPALAVEFSTEKAADIAITNGRGSAYAAYQILNLTTGLKAENQDDGHAEGEHTKDCYNYSYTLNSKYEAAVKETISKGDYSANVRAEIDKFTADENLDETEVIQTLELMTDPADIRQFADTIWAFIKNQEPEKVVELDEDAANDPSKNAVFNDMDQGYYLIVEKTSAEDPDAISLVMLDTAGQAKVTINSKEGVPTLTKQIKDTNDTTGETSDWQDAGDFDIGDDVQFLLTGTLPENIAGYDEYDYIFHDNLSAGLDLNPDSFIVTADDTQLKRDEGGYMGYTVRIKDTAENTTDGCSFEVEINDIKALIANGLLDETNGVVKVVYTAKLNGAAKTGVDGNENEAFLEFSNDPYNSDGRSKTPKDKVVGFTFKLTVDKKDKEGKDLPGAAFQLKKMNADGEWEDYPNGQIEITADQTEFEFVGLDSGRYLLTETHVPAGYNKADDIEFEVRATYAPTSGKIGEVPELENLEVFDASGKKISNDLLNPDENQTVDFNVTFADGDMATVVVNSTGVRLPSTGGAGAYLLYGVGGIAVIGGGALYLNSRKKKENAQK